jgi:ribosomal protein S18 acetylase RimI-like enzyme
MNENRSIPDIRVALQSDASALASLLSQLADEHLDDIGIVIDTHPVLPEHGTAILQLLQSQGATLFVAEQERALSGFLLLAQAEDCAGDAGITVAVAGSHRRRGIASALLAAAQAQRRASGSGGLCLTVREHNGPAIALYRKAGFGTMGETDTGIEMRWQDN